MMCVLRSVVRVRVVGEKREEQTDSGAAAVKVQVCDLGLQGPAVRFGQVPERSGSEVGARNPEIRGALEWCRPGYLRLGSCLAYPAWAEAVGFVTPASSRVFGSSGDTYSVSANSNLASGALASRHVRL